jgi:hypothetical protein
LYIVSALANVANPVTGEVFAADSPYQLPTVIRALFAAQRALESRLHEEGPRATQPIPAATVRKALSTNAGKPWSSDEDRQLLAAFDANQPLAEIARTHCRTVGGVRARLEKHGRLEPSTATRWQQNPSPPANQGNGSRQADRGT